MLLCQLTASVTFNDLVGSITLVGNEDLGDGGAGVLVYLLQPILNVVEGLLFSAVINQDDSHGSLVVSLGDCSESFLSSSVPNLQLDSLLVDIDGLNLEVNA